MSREPATLQQYRLSVRLSSVDVSSLALRVLPNVVVVVLLLVSGAGPPV